MYADNEVIFKGLIEDIAATIAGAELSGLIILSNSTTGTTETISFKAADGQVEYEAEGSEEDEMFDEYEEYDKVEEEF